ncbi:MAG TPA: NUDIX hydrolase [Solirubrobacteraceae bacterium]|nr:NUDIX hydrolase [Solirubrobacteraceae bacterium]
MKRPTTEERLRREGEPTTPRQSASLILVRDGDRGLELLLVRRSPAQRFMGGFWVFPGGAVDPGEDHRAAAVRELAEEAGVTDLAPEALVEYSRWITPELIEIRFDTRFFVARAPARVRPRVDGEECVDLRWTTPRAALDAYARSELALVFPTLRHLEQLSAFTTVDLLLEHAREREIVAVLPRVVLGADEPRVVLPGEPGYDDE